MKQQMDAQYITPDPIIAPANNGESFVEPNCARLAPKTAVAMPMKILALVIAR